MTLQGLLLQGWRSLDAHPGGKGAVGWAVGTGELGGGLSTMALLFPAHLGCFQA